MGETRGGEVREIKVSGRKVSRRIEGESKEVREVRGNKGKKSRGKREKSK